MAVAGGDFQFEQTGVPWLGPTGSVGVFPGGLEQWQYPGQSSRPCRAVRKLSQWSCVYGVGRLWSEYPQLNSTDAPHPGHIPLPSLGNTPLFILLFLLILLSTLED